MLVQFHTPAFCSVWGINMKQYSELEFKNGFFESGYTVLPGFCDMHVHFRQPGFIYKETIATGSHAAEKGGFTTVCTMPNLNPVPDCYHNLLPQLQAIYETATVRVLPYGAITVGEKGELLSAMDELAPWVCGFSDDGRGVQSEDVMRSAMKKAKSLGKLIAAHCEDNTLLHGGYIHDGEYAHKHGHRGICSASEYLQIERDLKLVSETGCAYHVCHISCAESVELIRKAKAAGLDVTCETAPHYLVLCDSDIQEHGRFKMNPPLRSERDKDALLQGIADGVIDAIATDHAPHSAEEKSRGLEKSLFGVTGLELAFPVLYTELVKKNIITLEKLIELMSVNPCKRLGIAPNGYSAWDLSEEFTVTQDKLVSMGKSTPFEGRTLYGVCKGVFVKK